MRHISLHFRCHLGPGCGGFVIEDSIVLGMKCGVELYGHNLFSADWILEIPHSAVTQVTHEETTLNAWVSFMYGEMVETRVVQIQPMRRGVSAEANQELFGMLNAFHRGQSEISI
jgi:hypothetical protein